MRIAATLALLSTLLLPAAPAVAADEPLLKEWDVEYGGRPRDPYVAPDGKVWFVGQAGNYIANFDPATEAFRRYEIEDGTNPHNLVVAPDGIVWYAGNRNGRIGRLDPKTGEIKAFMTGEARDPHTLIFDGKGHIWFSSQQSNRIGRFDMKTGEYRLVTPYETSSRPYGIVLDPEGRPWVALLATPYLVRLDPESLAVTRFEEKSPDSRSRRPEVTSDGIVWYGDEARGFLGRLDPATGKIREYALPGGADSRPYAIAKDGQGRIWLSQTGPDKKLVGFDPKTERFFSVNEVSQTIRHMMYDEKTGAIWFGTDANRIGRILTRQAGQ